MTNTISTYLTLNSKKVFLALGLSMAVLLSFSVSPALAGDACTQNTDCTEADEICDLTSLDDNDEGECITDPTYVDPAGSGTSGIDNDPTSDNYGVDTYGSKIGLGDKRLDDAVVGLINVLLGFLGLIAVVIILIGGFRWMTAGGNEDKVAEARKTIFSGVIGLAIILFAWGIVTFVVDELVQASTK